MKTLFIGGTRRGYQALEALLAARAEVAGILSLTQDAHEMERFEEPLRALARRHDLPIRETRFVQGPEWARWAGEELGAEVGFAVGARVLLPAAFYSVFPRGCWAVHDSLLPEYRGFAPLNWAIINDEPETGVTLFRISELMDGGEILGQRRLAIGPDETAPELYERVCAATADVLLEGYGALARGEAVPRPQDYATGSFTASRTPADGLIDWAQPTRRVYGLIRALTFPYPGAFTYLQGRRLWVLSAKPVEDAGRFVGRITGRVIRILPGQGVDVLTGDGVLRLQEVSLDGSTRLPAAEVIRSVRSRLGLDLVQLATRLAELEQKLEGQAAHE